LTGEYEFDASRLHLAHAICQQSARDALTTGADAIVSNTFTTLKELKPYFKLAKEFKIVPTVILCQNMFGNVHNVPVEALDRMRDRFAYDISSLFNEGGE